MRNLLYQELPPRQVIYLYINHLEQNNGLEFSRTQDHR